MVSEHKRISKKTWGVMISLLLVIIVMLVVVLVGMMMSGESDSGSVSSDEELDIIAPLDENLKFYNPEIEYQVGDVHMLTDEYAVVMLSVDGINYRALMDNSSGEWKVLSYPRIVFSYEDFLEVPEEVLKKANEVGR